MGGLIRRGYGVALFLTLFRTVLGQSGLYDNGEDVCPRSCGSFTATPANWTSYHDLGRLDLCGRPMLLDFNIFTPLDDPTKTTTIRACTVDSEATLKTKRQTNQSEPGIPSSNAVLKISRLEIVDSTNTSTIAGTLSGGTELQKLLQVNAVTDNGIIFAKYGNTIWGIFVGTRVLGAAVASNILQRLLDDSHGSAAPGVMMQVCGTTRAADTVTGIAFLQDTSGLPVVQQIVATWTNGTCSDKWGTPQPLEEIEIPLDPIETSTSSGTSNFGRGLMQRADCRTIQVASGDSCGSLAQKCGISGADYTKYNPASNHCSTLKPGQRVCCSSGTLPDYSPKPNSDGTCASYSVKSGDSCFQIGGTYDLEITEIESFNKQTWGWGGCNNLQVGTAMCLSTGKPPMPNPVANAVCGPQKPGTKQPTNGESLASLNPCPLNACCNVWGQCGTVPEFCTESGTGAPGTAKPGTNGCISNCGTNIVNNGAAPASFRRIGYFEAFNGDRPCLHMDVSQIDGSAYDTIHFGFVDITQDFQVNTNSYHQQFLKFSNMTGFKKIISFGGWGFSTEPATYMVLRNGAKAANRETFATNIANFAKRYNLDGVDIDWEYAGAPDIPGIPPADADEGSNYLALLRLLRTKLPSNKSLSIAAPASYWYLKAFPIKAMASVLDYIVYMTYDLHGQWDYGSQWASPGCPKGDCLRSHVNSTETQLALSMITKAGVPANKILVGVSSYGRSFAMTSAGCTGPMCTYKGPQSAATPGECTKTAGYLANAEINHIISTNSKVTTFKDKWGSNIMVYNDNQWVAYMDDAEKSSRTAQYKALNFAGTSDWAIDLQKVYGQPPSQSGSTDPDLPVANGAMDPYLSGCSSAEAKKVQEAWREAAELAKAGYEWNPGRKWQPAMDLYLGKSTKNDNGWFSYGYRWKNIMRQYDIHYAASNAAPKRTYAYFTCDSKNQIGDCKKFPTINAYTTDSIGWFWTNHEVYFCKKFFDDTVFTSLASRVAEAKRDTSLQRVINKKWRAVRARTLMHETYHWKDTVTQPRALDKGYQPSEVAWLAANDEDTAGINAESYTQAALAIYMQKTFNLKDPPQPDGGLKKPPNYPNAAATDEEIGDFNVESVDPMPPPVPIDQEEFIPNNSTGSVIRMSSMDGGANSGPRPLDCYNGEVYVDRKQCGVFCSDGKCEEQKLSDHSEWKCNCAGGICKAGKYNDRNTCYDNCFHGLCMESAGVPGATCQDCP